MIAKVLQSGITTTIQDGGRIGYRAQGMPQSGAVDAVSFQLANWLVGNRLSAAVLEIPMGNLELIFQEACQIGFTGGIGELLVNDTYTDFNRTITIVPGDRVQLGALHTGNYAYLSISGGWAGHEFLSSVSTHLASGVGGLKRKLEAGDELEVSSGQRSLIPERKVPEHLQVKIDLERPIRFIAGPEFDRLSSNAQRALIQDNFHISSQSNRMGIRLTSHEGLILRPQKAMISCPVTLGTIQLPPNGQPIILLNDSQSIGGYARIGKIIDVDLGYLVQQPAGTAISLKETTLENALRLLKHQQAKLDSFVSV
ncbi:MAG: biotin-dependent carboxyltransferase family protein [Saprospiraceae bacterium]|nr:biotin-dependent carboxyltransferase family protein [Saprospiraceae bacterium]